MLDGALSVFRGLLHVGFDRLRERSAQRERAAAVAPVLTLLTEANPDVLLALSGDRGRIEGLMAEFYDRWRELRDPLARFCTGDASRRVVESGERLIEAVSQMLNATHYLVMFATSNPSTLWSAREAASSRHREAVAAARSLLDKIERESAGAMS